MLELGERSTRKWSCRGRWGGTYSLLPLLRRLELLMRLDFHLWQGSEWEHMIPFLFHKNYLDYSVEHRGKMAGRGPCGCRSLNIKQRWPGQWSEEWSSVGSKITQDLVADSTWKRKSNTSWWPEWIFKGKCVRRIKSGDFLKFATDCVSDSVFDCFRASRAIPGNRAAKFLPSHLAARQDAQNSWVWAPVLLFSHIEILGETLHV